MALDTLRKGAARTLGLILVGLLVISFAIWGIADIFTGYGRQTLIRVGDTEITSQDYLRAQQEVLRAMSSQAGRSLSLQEARALGLDDRGTLEAGKRCDLAIWNVELPAELVCRMGFNPLHARVVEGQ